MLDDMHDFWLILKETGMKWWEDKVPRLGAALAFYSTLSIGPLLLIVIATAGLVFGRDAVSGRLSEQMESLLGSEAAAMLQTVIANSYQPDDGMIAAVIGVTMLLFAASGVFAQLQDALNTIWDIKPEPGRTVFRILKDRFLSFSMVLGTGFLLLISLSVSAGLAAIGGSWFGEISTAAPFLEALNFAIGFGIVTLLFAMIFKILPDAHIRWSDVWLGAAVTAALFNIGKFLIGMYLGRSALSSTYGAAGSLMVILFWVYYSSQILFFGAELTQVYSNFKGRRISPYTGASFHNSPTKQQVLPPVPQSSSVTPILMLSVAAWGYFKLKKIQRRHPVLRYGSLLRRLMR